MLSLAQLLLNARTDLPTSLGTADLRSLGADILRQSLFSARMTNASAVQGLRSSITGILTGTDGQSADNLADARLHLRQLGDMLNYDPKTGYPGDKDIPTAEAGELRDLYSTDRMNLQLKTNLQIVQGAAKNIWGNTPEAVDQYPAWELVRVEAREIPRGEKRTKHGIIDVPEDAWDGHDGRWRAACIASGDDEALEIFESTGRMVARKDSGVWQALSDGAGGYDDAIDNAGAEPYAFNSGMGREQVGAKEFEELGGDPDDIEPQEPELGSDQVKIPKQRFDPDILQTFKQGLESGDIKYRVKVEVVA